MRTSPKYVIKRDGTKVPFDERRIEKAILKAFSALNIKPKRTFIKKVVLNIVSKLPKVPGVEDIQDIVEKELMKSHPSVAKAYILYRHKRAIERELKYFIGVKDDLKLSPNAIEVLKKRYLLRDDKGRIVETPSQMFWRVAKHVAKAERKYGGNSASYAKAFYSIMANREFLPNSPTLMNAGTSIGQLSACFVLPIEDSIDSIFDTLKRMAKIHQSGGGTGFNFSHIRPKGDIVKSTKGVASGPVSFMEIFDKATDVIKQGGKRRGANMGILNVDHPDIEEFIRAKSYEGRLTNFNLSVGVTDKFMRAVIKNKKYPLINPRTGKVVREVDANSLFNLIVANAYYYAEPGLLFFDEINRKNPTPIYPIEATNPCGEVPMPNYESCNLGSINVEKFVDFDWSNKPWKKKVNWKRLREVVRLAVRFLDDVIDVNKFPIKEIEKATKRHRRIGLGIMGFANALYKMGIRYGSKESFRFADTLMSFIHEEAVRMSEELGIIRGSFPEFKNSVWSKTKKAMRNAALTSIAPTGSISMIADTSSSIEPNFGLAYFKIVLGGEKLFYTNKYFESVLRSMSLWDKSIVKHVINYGTIQNTDLPKKVKDVFVTTYDIKPEDHVKMQATFQKHVDLAVSKTVNLPETATLDDVKNVILLAWKLKCKGITIYRKGSRKDVFYIGVCKQCTV